MSNDTSGGTVSGGGKRVTYGELIGGKNFSITLDPKNAVPTKDPKDFAILGKSIPRVDIPGKVAGTFTYMQDFRVPGMLHGRVVRPPAIGAKLESVDEASIKGIPTAKVVREGNLLAVVAASEWAAVKGASQLKATWSPWEGLPEQTKLMNTCAPPRSPRTRRPARLATAPRRLARAPKD